jgi:3,4-dihydroxy 2-butanone 4-phosphate synthase/GTP cyclohydrolase II
MSRLSVALDALRQGRMIILVDDEDRENEGDLIVAAEFATPEVVNFMAMKGRGLICLTLTGEQVDKFGLPAMVSDNKGRRSTAFTVSIEATEGVTTGISAYDRARTIEAAVNPNAHPDDIVSPGHVFPLRAQEGGVLVRNGHTEGSVDLMKLAGLQPAGVICEIMNDDGHMARRPDLDVFAAEHDLPILTIQEIVTHRYLTESVVDEVATAKLPSAFSNEPLTVRAFSSLVDGTEHLVVIKGDPDSQSIPLVRVHSECLTGDALGSLRCDCGAQLQESLSLISEVDFGMVVYLRGQEGRGIGLANKIRAYAQQDQGLDTVEANLALGFDADARDYGIAAQILKSLNVTELDLLSNNPAKVEGLQRYGLTVRNQKPLVMTPNPFNATYLDTKRDKFGHALASPQAGDLIGETHATKSQAIGF